MHRATRRLALTFGLAALVAAAAPSLATSDGTKPYKLVVVTAGVPSGGSVQMTATFTNESTTQQLGSANLFWPTPLTVTSAKVGTTAQGIGRSCTFRTLTAPCVQVRNLNLAPGASATVSMTVTVPACTIASGAWSAEVKQANNFNGTGNDLNLDAAGSVLSPTIDNHCHLVWGVQPHGAVQGQAISDADYTPPPTGGPIKVDVLDPSNAIANTTAQVTVGIGSNPGGATLGGTTTVAAKAGVASFGTLTLDREGHGFTLTASGTGMDGATSSQFTIQGTGTSCRGSCSLTVTGTAGHAQVNASSTGGSGTLVESANSPGQSTLSCAGYTTSDPDTYEFFTTSAAFSKVVVLTITNPTGVPANTAHNVLPAQQICFQAPYPFTANAGTQASFDGTAYTGLLPDCTTGFAGPCHARGSDAIVRDSNSPVGYDIVLVANVPANGLDPRMN